MLSNGCELEKAAFADKRTCVVQCTVKHLNSGIVSTEFIFHCLKISPKQRIEWVPLLRGSTVFLNSRLAFNLSKQKHISK